jgi:protein O-mannosyl-transferase
MAEEIDDNPDLTTVGRDAPSVGDKAADRGAGFPDWLCKFRVQAVIVAILSLLFYGNTFRNEAAFDDEIVISRNRYVLQGVAGLPGILTKDTYESYYRQYNTGNLLPGGRYRPLSLVTFAIEQQFFGAIPADQVEEIVNENAMEDNYAEQFVPQMHTRHVLNVLWFTLSMIVLLYFLRYIVLKDNLVVALLATILFTIHPIHTEVVANVKSRDEILSLLFICLTFIFAFKYREQKKKWLLWTAVGSYFLAFLSKEYAITLVALLPLAFYLFGRLNFKKSMLAAIPYFAVAALYLLIRIVILNHEGVHADTSGNNNLQVYANGTQKIATELSTSLNYLKLLVFPHPLSSDYSYNVIPNKDFSSPVVWLAVVFYMVLFAGFFYYFRKKSAVAFAIAFYLLNLILVSNLFIDIGTTMAERLIYHSSLGFVIPVAWLLYRGMERIGDKKIARLSLTGIMAVIIVLCGFTTIRRNAEWKNNYTLYLSDIKVVPNSSLVNGNAANVLMAAAEAEPDSVIKGKELRQAVVYFNKAIDMNKEFYALYVNRSYLYFLLREPDSAAADLDVVLKLHPACPKLAHMYFNVGVAFYKGARYPEALTEWQHAVDLEPDYDAPKNSIKILHDYNLVPKPPGDQDSVNHR